MMNATIEITDADANKERVRLKIRCINTGRAW
jgi:ribosomal protein S14